MLRYISSVCVKIGNFNSETPRKTEKLKRVFDGSKLREPAFSCKITVYEVAFSCKIPVCEVAFSCKKLVLILAFS